MSVELGLGLISIGRQWGVRPVPVPSEAEVSVLLDTAIAGGIHFFDTAPSYGGSEQRLGNYLRGAAADGLTIASKCGEHWDAGRGAPFVDHGYDALCRSIDRSLQHLPRIDLLQVHKASVAVLRDAGVRRALEYARRCGVAELGASVTDLETAREAVAAGFGWLQFFYNRESAQLEPAFEMAAGLQVIVNRPFAMGALADEPVEAFRFVLRRSFRGVVLSGTRSPEHLRKNVAAFAAARKTIR